MLRICKLGYLASKCRGFSRDQGFTSAVRALVRPFQVSNALTVSSRDLSSTLSTIQETKVEYDSEPDLGILLLLILIGD